MADVTEEMVEAAAAEMLRQYGSEFNASHLCSRDFLIDARAVVVAALAGRTVVDLPQPNAWRNKLDGRMSIWTIGGWSVTASGQYVEISTSADGLGGGGLGFQPARARRFGAALIAAADGLASESSGDGHHG